MNDRDADGAAISRPDSPLVEGGQGREGVDVAGTALWLSVLLTALVVFAAGFLTGGITGIFAPSLTAGVCAAIGAVVGWCGSKAVRS